MRYKNDRTGIVIETPCICEGIDWREVKPANHTPAKPKTKQRQAVKKDG